MNVCVITNDPESPLVPELNGEGSRLEFILIQDAVYRRDVPADRTFACGEDLRARKGESPYPGVDYREIVRKIFSADRVICL